MGNARTKEDVKEDSFRFPDATSEEYVAAVLKELDKQREDRYAHLPEAWWQRFRLLISFFS